MDLSTPPEVSHHMDIYMDTVLYHPQPGHHIPSSGDIERHILTEASPTHGLPLQGTASHTSFPSSTSDQNHFHMIYDLDSWKSDMMSMSDGLAYCPMPAHSYPFTTSRAPRSNTVGAEADTSPPTIYRSTSNSILQDYERLDILPVPTARSDTGNNDAQPHSVALDRVHAQLEYDFNAYSNPAGPTPTPTFGFAFDPALPLSAPATMTTFPSSIPPSFLHTYPLRQNQGGGGGGGGRRTLPSEWYDHSVPLPPQPDFSRRPSAISVSLQPHSQSPDLQEPATYSQGRKEEAEAEAEGEDGETEMDSDSDDDTPLGVRQSRTRRAMTPRTPSKTPKAVRIAPRRSILDVEVGPRPKGKPTFARLEAEAEAEADTENESEVEAGRLVKCWTPELELDAFLGKDHGIRLFGHSYQDRASKKKGEEGEGEGEEEEKMTITLKRCKSFAARLGSSSPIPSSPLQVEAPTPRQPSPILPINDSRKRQSGPKPLDAPVYFTRRSARHLCGTASAPLQYREYEPEEPVQGQNPESTDDDDAGSEDEYKESHKEEEEVDELESEDEKMELESEEKDVVQDQDLLLEVSGAEEQGDVEEEEEEEATGVVAGTAGESKVAEFDRWLKAPSAKSRFDFKIFWLMLDENKNERKGLMEWNENGTQVRIINLTKFLRGVWRYHAASEKSAAFTRSLGGYAFTRRTRGNVLFIARSDLHRTNVDAFKRVRKVGQMFISSAVAGDTLASEPQPKVNYRQISFRQTKLLAQKEETINALVDAICLAGVYREGNEPLLAVLTKYNFPIPAPPETAKNLPLDLAPGAEPIQETSSAGPSVAAPPEQVQSNKVIDTTKKKGSKGGIGVDKNGKASAPLESLDVNQTSTVPRGNIEKSENQNQSGNGSKAAAEHSEVIPEKEGRTGTKRKASAGSDKRKKARVKARAT